MTGFEIDPPFPVVGDVLVATPLALGSSGAPPGWSFDPEAGFWWHVVAAGEMWPQFDVLIFRLPTGTTAHDFS